MVRQTTLAEDEEIFVDTPTKTNVPLMTDSLLPEARPPSTSSAEHYSLGDMDSGQVTGVEGLSPKGSPKQSMRKVRLASRRGSNVSGLRPMSMHEDSSNAPHSPLLRMVGAFVSYLWLLAYLL